MLWSRPWRRREGMHDGIVAVTTAVSAALFRMCLCFGAYFLLKYWHGKRHA